MSRYPKMKSGGATAGAGHSKGPAARPRPFPANDPIPWAKNPFKDLGKAPAKVLLPKIAKKVLPRLVPGLGTAILAKDLFEYIQSTPSVVNASQGWTAGTCNISPDVSAGFRCYGYDRGCGTYQLPSACDSSNPRLPYNPTTALSIREYHNLVGTGYIRGVRWWRRVTGSGSSIPSTAPRYTPVPRSYPRLNPQDLPIHNPAPTPRPKPWPEALPLPGEQPSKAPDPAKSPRPKPRPGQSPRPRPGQRPRPRPRPRVRLPTLPVPIAIVPPTIPNPGGQPLPVVPDTTVVTVPSPASPPRVTTRPGSSTNRRPPRGTYEPPKTNIRTVAGKAWTVINVATETNDFIGALWKGVPKDKRTKPRGIWQVSPHEKLGDIWRNRKSINYAQALAAYANNQFEDWVYGQLGMAAGKTSRQANLTTGLSGAVKRAGSNAPDNETKPLPELVFDEEAGEVRLDYAGESLVLYP